MSYVFSFYVSPEFDKLQILDIMNLHVNTKQDLNLSDNKDYQALADDPVLLPKKIENLIGFYIPLGSSYPHIFLDTIIHFSSIYGVKETEPYTNNQMSSLFINGYKYFIAQNDNVIKKIEHPEFITFDEEKRLIFSPQHPYVNLEHNEKIVNFLILQNTLFKNNKFFEQKTDDYIR